MNKILLIETDAQKLKKAKKYITKMSQSLNDAVIIIKNLEQEKVDLIALNDEYKKTIKFFETANEPD